MLKKFKITGKRKFCKIFIYSLYKSLTILLFRDMKEFNLEVDYLITNDSSGPMKQVDFKYSALGKI